MNWKSMLIGSILLAALAPCARAQTFGIGGSVGLVNDVSDDLSLDEFDHSEVTGWLDYQFEKSSILRLTYGSMRTQQSGDATITVEEDGELVTRELKERVNYLTIGVSYLFWQKFFTSGLFAGLGGYHIKPDTVPPGYEGPHDINETVFGWHAGSEAIFRVSKNLGIVGRLTYHNVSSHPHRQFLNMDAGLVARF